MSHPDFYGAVYFSDNVIVRIQPDSAFGDSDSDDVLEIIEAFGYPTLEDVK